MNETNGKSAFEAMFQESVFDYKIGPEAVLTKPINFVMAGNGVFEVRRNAIGTFVRRTDKVDGLKYIKEGFHWTLPKVPWGFFDQAVAFFRAVMAKHGGAEAYMQILWDKTKREYFVYVPRQYVSGGGVNFDRDADLERENVLVLEIHSHNSMGAFWSGTDNADERGDRLFMVVGRLNTRVPQVRCRCCVGGTHHDLELDDIFEEPAGTAPESWLAQVRQAEEVQRRKPTVAVTAFAGRPAEASGVAQRSLTTIYEMLSGKPSHNDDGQGVLFDDDGPISRDDREVPDEQGMPNERPSEVSGLRKPDPGGRRHG